MKNNTTTISPYLTFNGNCQEAMNFYKEALSGELEVMPFEGSPMEVPDAYKGKVMHSCLKSGNATIMASDTMPDQSIKMGDNFSVSVSCNDLNEAQGYFDKLSKGGTVTMPFEETFWGAKFGMIKDKFGIHWMVNCELKKD